MTDRDAFAALTARQRELLARWLPDAVVVADHSWGLVERAVLEVTAGGERYVVKAGGPDDHHMAREVGAYERWLTPWTAIGRAPRLAHADADARLLVTHLLPGLLVEGSPADGDPGTYRQAGRLLALLHRQASRVDATYEQRRNRRALAWLDGPHRIPADDERRLRAEVASWPDGPATVVPTHGDWQPRNWLVHDGVVSVIDLGRFDLRPAMTDLTRLAARQFQRDPGLEAAFLEGYGGDPREPDAWRREQVREAIATAAWAHQVGDEAFEAEGLATTTGLLRAGGA